MKKVLRGLFLSLFLTLALITNVVIRPNCVEVSAASTNKYILNMDYTETYSSYGMSAPQVTSGTSTTLTFGGHNQRSLELYIYGSSHTSTVETANSGHRFDFNDITIAVETDYSINRTNQINSYSVRNVNGTVVASSTTASQPTTLYSGNLEDGSYYINLVWYGEDYFTSYPNYTQQSATFSITYSFQVDGNAPVITGASTSKTYYETSDFEVSATDSGSGLKKLYIKNPNATSFTACPNPCQITNGINGLYSFYAVDNSGNESEIHYVYYDETPPTGVITNSKGTTISSSYTNAQFFYSATDADSGVKIMEWKTPLDNVWQDYPTEVLTLVSTNGTYYFRTRDNAGNYSSIRTMNYDTKAPTMSFYNENGVVANGSVVSGEYIYYSANGTGTGVRSAYVLMPGATSYVAASTSTQYLASGKYSFYCYDYAGNRSSTYSVTLDNESPILSVEGATFGTTTQFEFRVTAEDDSVCELYYKGPNDLDYRVSSNNYVDITYDMDEGTYYFYAVDQFGNRSGEKSIEFSQAAPEILIQYDEETNHYMLTWFDNTYTVGVNGMEYFSGGKLTEEGDYEIVVIAQNGKTTTYNVTIDHKWVITGWVEATCLAEGYSINECLTCDGVIYGNWTGIGDHIPEVIDVVEPTCEEDGYTLYQCEYCLFQWKSDYVEALEHEFYVAGSVAATCQAEGYTINKCKNCDVVINGNWTGIGDHVPVVIEVVAPTCEEDGYTLYHCDYCLTQWKSNYVDAIDHEFYVAGSVEATCQQEGYTINKCKHCGVVINGNWTGIGDHSKTEKEVVNPTCSSQGYTLYFCDICFTEWKGNYVDALPHNYEETTYEANCMNKGYTHYECLDCGYSYDDNYVDVLGHDYEITNKVGSCEEEGSITYKCSLCGYTYSESVGFGSHSYLTTTVTPTCLDKGYTQYECSLCGNIYYDNYVSATGHNYIKTVVDPTCTTNGYTEYECSYCGDSYQNNTTLAIGHKYIETNREPTCTKSGGTFYSCMFCSSEYQTNEILPVGHAYETEILKESDCIHEGKRRYYCPKCGDEYEIIIPATGHNYQLINENNKNGVVERTYKCSDCGDNYSEALGDQYDKVATYVIDLVNKYNPYIVYVFTATAGLWSIGMGVAYAVAQKNEDKVKAKKMLVNYIIGIVAIFVILVALPYLVKGIAILLS